MLSKNLLVITASTILITLKVAAQSIIDPCFSSISPVGKYNDSPDLVNLCACDNNFIASDLIEWDGSKWLGTLTSNIRRPPPDGCNTKAIWMGYNWWTAGGEGFGMRLDKPLEADKTYSFTFTYAKDGNDILDEFDVDEFSPYVYTDRAFPSIRKAYNVGRLPATIDWKTSTITFTATPAQKGHDWLIIHTYDCSGSVMSNCNVLNPIEDISLPRDTTLCIGDTAVLHAPKNDRYKYVWNTGDTTSSISVKDEGFYSVSIFNEKCHSQDSVTLKFKNCEVIFDIPNIFTPNSDAYNQTFVPKELNYVDTGQMTIFNRWGEKIFNGNLLRGWDGKWNGELVPSGVYFYDIHYVDSYGIVHKIRGTVSLVR